MGPFDTNNFKKRVRQWISVNPHGEIEDLRDFCEELIPPQQYMAYQWLVNQTLSWFKSTRQTYTEMSDWNELESD